MVIVHHEFVHRLLALTIPVIELYATERRDTASRTSPTNTTALSPLLEQGVGGLSIVEIEILMKTDLSLCRAESGEREECEYATQHVCDRQLRN